MAYPILCDDCRRKQERMFSRDSRRINRCRMCKKDATTREHENYCDSCAEESRICRDCGKRTD